MYYFSHSGYGYSKKLCKDITSWFVGNYLSRYKLDIDVIHRGLKRECVFGWCNLTGDSYRPRDFQIEIDTHLDIKTYTLTLIHELIHVRQWVMGTLKMKSGRTFFNDNYDGSEYHNQGHEIEAHQQESILYEKFLLDRYGVTVEEVSFFYPKLGF